MKKALVPILISAAVGAVVALALTVYVLLSGAGQPVKVTVEQPAQEQKLGERFALEIRDTNGDTYATTTLLYLDSTVASSTLSFLSERATQIDLNLFARATSTATAYLWRIEFSANNKDWYCEDGSTATNNIVRTHGAGC